jgi:hypothetical protein
MEIKIEVGTWGIGFYSNFLGVDITWGFLGLLGVIYLINRIATNKKILWKRVK